MLTKHVSLVPAVWLRLMGSMPPVNAQHHVQAMETVKVLNPFAARMGNTTGINASWTGRLVDYGGILQPDFLANVVRFNFVKFPTCAAYPVGNTKIDCMLTDWLLSNFLQDFSS